MNDTPAKDSGDEAEELKAGERLAAARQTLNISITDVAKELHLDEPKVLALEENRFEDLGAPVFAKGHMRKYAELVGVPIDDLLVDYYQLNRAAGAPPVVGPKRRPPSDISLGPWIMTAVVVIIASASAWWWFNREPTPDPVEVEPAVLAPFAGSMTGEPATEPPAAIPEQDSAQPEAAITPTAGDDVPEPVRVDDQDLAIGQNNIADIPAADLLQLQLSFTGDCWTEVTDADGQRLYFEMGVAGGTASISGAAPFRILLGSSDNVSLMVDGAEYTIPASQRRGNTARLTINKQ